MTDDDGHSGSASLETGSEEGSYEGVVHEHVVHEHVDDIDFVGSNDISNLLSRVSTSEGTGGWVGSIFLIVNAALGAGLLDFPQAYDKAGGILISMIIQTILVLVSVVSLLILAYCAKKHSCSTYQEVVLRTCGRKMEILCSVFITLYTYGTCITFIIILGDLSDRTLSSLYGSSFCHQWYFTRQIVMIVASVLFILPLCFSKKIDFLKYPSLLGVIAVFYIVGLVIYEFYLGGFPAPRDIKTAPEHWEDVLTVIPVICFGYQCHVSSVPIYACMEDKKISTFARSILAAITICALVYSVAGIYGYLIFGTDVASDILLAFDASNPIVLVALIALALKIITTYPILMFCGRLALDDLLSIQSDQVKRMSLSLVWFFSSVLIACYVPNISDAISCVGAMAALFIFVFPAIALLQTTAHIDPLYKRAQTQVIFVYALISVAIGMFVFGQVLSKFVWDMVSGEDKSSDIILCH